VSNTETCRLIPKNLRIEFLCARRAEGMRIVALEIISTVLESVSPTASTIADSLATCAYGENCAEVLSLQNRICGFSFHYLACPFGVVSRR
jgi:hypothetical protein